MYFLKSGFTYIMKHNLHSLNGSGKILIYALSRACSCENVRSFLVLWVYTQVGRVYENVHVNIEHV